MTEGVGLCQREGGPIEVIRPGDRVFFEPGENHWHGAAPNRFMVHIAMQQNDETGSPVTWGEHVTDEQYAAARSGAGMRHMNPTYDFSGQVALVTGAGAGMGLDTARAFAAAGAAVVLADVNEQALRAATDELTAAGHQALGVACDVCRRTTRSPRSSIAPSPSSADSTWPSTTPGSCCPPPTRPMNRPRASTASRPSTCAASGRA